MQKKKSTNKEYVWPLYMYFRSLLLGPGSDFMMSGYLPSVSVVDSIGTWSSKSTRSSVISGVLPHSQLWHCTQITEQFKPAFLQLHFILQALLNGQDVKLNKTRGANSLIMVTGMSPCPSYIELHLALFVSQLCLNL